MMRPPGWDGVAFSDRSHGDLRGDMTAREAVSADLGISEQWATARQVHGSDVKRVSSSGPSGDADGLWTTERGLPVAIFTADCYGVVLTAPAAVGVAHAGWRGVVSGVVPNLRDSMSRGGHAPDLAAVGPGIGPCCFEVGPEVVAQFEPGDVTTTTWGTPSVDLASVLQRQLDGLEVWMIDVCTHHGEQWFSHRADGTAQRMASIGWLLE